MPRSMTGYGYGEGAIGEHRLTIEIKAVNNRYQDFNIRLPRRLNAYEGELRAFLKEKIWRGKVDVFIVEELASDAKTTLSTNESLAKNYVDAARALATQLHLEDSFSANDLFRLPEVFTLEELPQNEEETRQLLFSVLRDAVGAFVDTAKTEGDHLRCDLEAKLQLLADDVEKVIAREPEIVAAYREKLYEKVKEVLEDAEADSAQMVQAAVLYADKISTDEETIRLRSHISQMMEALREEEEGIGRKLDFLTQEMNREANTILSKAGDLLTADLGIEMKTTIEKIREQIQNIA